MNAGAATALTKTSTSSSSNRQKPKSSAKVPEKIIVVVSVKNLNARKSIASVSAQVSLVLNHVNVKIARILFHLLKKVMKTAIKNANLLQINKKVKLT